VYGYLKVGFKVCQDYVGGVRLDTRGVGLRRIYKERSLVQ
jgi:hypothetical protein